ncbi:MAG TPA: DUF1080 domain-containing protein [Phycisphaerales bacterium]|nr:DUF1080 domain-containing protein [Phycisphaerales bacterium]
MIDSKKLILLIVLAAAVLLPCSFADQSEPAVANILEKMPADNAKIERELSAEIIKAGSGAITTICDLIVPPGTGDDTKARYALSSLSFYTSRSNADGGRSRYIAVLNEVLAKATDKEVQSFFISQLQLVVREETVSPYLLSGYLRDERLCEPATMALLAIGTDAAEKAFLNALRTADQKNLPTIIHALGQMQSKAAADAISKHASSKDTITRLISLRALANIADKSADRLLEKALAKASGPERGRIASFYLLYAQRLTENNRQRQAAKICRKLIKNRTYDVGANIQCAALSILVSAESNRALNDLLDAMDNKSIKVQAAALALADSIKGRLVTNKWVKKTQRVSPQVRVRIIDMLADRGDGYAMDAITKYLQDEDKQVRLAAIKAVVALGGDKGIDTVLSLLLKTKDADEIETVKQSLLYLKGTFVIPAVAKILPKMPPDPQVALIEFLALRNAKEHADVVFDRAEDKNDSVRLAALKAAAILASPKDMAKLVEFFVDAKTPEDRAAAQNAVVAIAKQMPLNQGRTEPLLNAIDKADDDKKIYLLPALGQIGGRRALVRVLAEAKSDNEDVRDIAIRTLTKWTDAEAIPELLNVIASSDVLAHQVLAVRGVIRLTKAAKISPGEKIAIFDKALGLVKRPEEKKLLIASLGSIRRIESLQIVSTYLGDKSVQKEAVLASVKIACPINKKDKGLKNYEAAVLLKRVLQFTDDVELIEKIDKHISSIDEPAATLKPTPEGFVPLFNGKDLAGWKGLLAKPNDNPIKRAKLSGDQLAKAQAKADESMRKHWDVVDGVLQFDGDGFSLATVKNYEDFEMLVDWKIVHPNGDSGIYLRGSPQVQIWDPAFKKFGSGGLYNNKKNPGNPEIIADNPIGQWNTFRIKMIGDKVTVHLNDKLVVDNVTLENYWDRSQPIFPREQIELQCHGDPIHFKNIFIREIEEGFVSLFNGKNLTGWVGDTEGYIVEDGKIVCKPGGNLYTEKQYSDFVLRFDFKLTSGANNGLGLRTLRDVNAAYQGMELQILDDSADKYKNLKEYQYHGSIYGVMPAKRGHLKPIGQWNSQEVIAKGKHITVKLNGKTILDADEADIDRAIKDGKTDGRKHPGLKRTTGHIAFLGHGSVVEFRNIRIKTQ